MSEFNNVLEYVEAFLDEEKTIEYGDDEFVIKVNENVSINDVYNAITTIVDNVVEREFEYELIDLMIPYYLINLFTDMDAPMIKEDGEDYPDFESCYKIAAYLNLEYELTQTSPIVANYIYMMTQNIWRRLDYHKSQGAYLKRELMDSIASFYEIIDELDKVAEQQKDVDVEKFMNQLNDISDALQEFNHEYKEVNKGSANNSKSSVALAVVKDN